MPPHRRARRFPSTRPLRILFVAPYVPSPLRPRPFHLVRGLAGLGHRLTVLAAATSARELDDAADLAPHCDRVHAIRIPLVRSLWSCAAGLAGAAPLQARFCFAPAMRAQVQSALAAPAGYDILHVEHLRAALYGFGTAGLPRVYDAVDCMSRLQAHTVADGPTWSSQLVARAELPRTRRFERALLADFNRILVAAESDREALLALAGTARDTATPPERVHVVRNGVDTTYFTAADVPRDPATLVFVGRMAYHANLAAAGALITQLLPRLWARRPETRLVIVGADPPPALRALAERAGSRVEVTGYVQDVRPYLARATVAVNPLPYAVGIQNKVLEAMATATPVVATPAACAALDAVPGQDLLVAPEPDGLVIAVERLLDDPSLARRVGAAGRRYVEVHHDWQAAARALAEIYRDTSAAHAAAEFPHAGAGAA